MSQVHEILNSVGTLLALVGVLWVAAVKMTRLEVKVDTMWSMLLKRAVVEGVSLGLMEVHSPIRLVNNSGKILESMSEELQKFYIEKCKGLDEAHSALEIEREFGARLVKDICIPNNISFGVCILIALAIAKNEDTLVEILDDNLPEKKK